MAHRHTLKLDLLVSAARWRCFLHYKCKFLIIYWMLYYTNYSSKPYWAFLHYSVVYHVRSVKMQISFNVLN